LKALLERIKIAADLQIIVVLPLLQAFEGAVDHPSIIMLRIQLY
jgi:hypothetical protein